MKPILKGSILQVNEEITTVQNHKSLHLVVIWAYITDKKVKAWLHLKAYQTPKDNHILLLKKLLIRSNLQLKRVLVKEKDFKRWITIKVLFPSVHIVVLYILYNLNNNVCKV